MVELVQTRRRLLLLQEVACVGLLSFPFWKGCDVCLCWLLLLVCLFSREDWNNSSLPSIYQMLVIFQKAPSLIIREAEWWWKVLSLCLVNCTFHPVICLVEQIYLPSKNSSNKTKNFPLEKSNQLTDISFSRNVLNVIALQFVLQHIMLSLSHFMSLCFSVTDYLYPLPTDFLMKHL